MPTRRFALSLDALLLLLFLVLLSPRITGLALHEWLGIGLAAPVLLHLLLSWRWIATATRRFLTRSDLRQRVNFLLNALLLVLLVVVVVTGAGISAAALPSLGVATVDDGRWRHIHNATSDWLFLATAAHLAMNWTWVRTTVRRWSAPRPARPSRAAVRARLLRHGGRLALLLLAASAVGAATYAWLGAPLPGRVRHQDEIARFAALPSSGVKKLAVEVAFFCLAAWVARRGLRVRLEPARDRRAHEAP